MTASNVLRLVAAGTLAHGMIRLSDGRLEVTQRAISMSEYQPQKQLRLPGVSLTRERKRRG